MAKIFGFVATQALFSAGLSVCLIEVNVTNGVLLYPICETDVPVAARVFEPQTGTSSTGAGLTISVIGFVCGVPPNHCYDVVRQPSRFSDSADH